ncbi:hypothetical protein L1987_30240 [Smallanthus sonchifolius]|uniref:Uncharacterized protein n=1 Tax=Smallanthus sonchifolius TaxID=185202 RepID=A0ACB9I2A6_9ASTR|nr:hypothetical protein L1987_30240 [Smallanthus sonchifolius]
MENMVQVTNMVNYDNEIGTSQKPPKLLNLADYSNWKDRFDQFVSFTDTSLWIPILEGYMHPTYSWMGQDNVPKPVSALTNEEKVLFDREKKAMASISIFYHLLSELSSASVVYETEEINDKFLEALPSKFDVYTVLIKENIKYKTMSLEEVLGKIQSHDLNMKKKETNMEHIQDPSMYFAKTTGKTGTGIAFFSGDAQDSSKDQSSGVPIHSGHSSHSGFSATTASTSSRSHVNQKVADDYLAILTLLIRKK